MHLDGPAPIRFRRIYESLNSDLSKPFDEAEHEANVKANYARVEAEQVREAALRAAGVPPCPCCGEYHDA
jgi:hypothetical protein